MDSVNINYKYQCYPIFLAAAWTAQRRAIDVHSDSQTIVCTSGAFNILETHAKHIFLFYKTSCWFYALTSKAYPLVFSDREHIEDLQVV